MLDSVKKAATELLCGSRIQTNLFTCMNLQAVFQHKVNYSVQKTAVRSDCGTIGEKNGYYPFSLHTRQTDVLFAVVLKWFTICLRIIILPPSLLTGIRNPSCDLLLLLFFAAAHIAIVYAIFPNVKQISRNFLYFLYPHLFPDTSLLIKIVQRHADRRHYPRDRIAGYDLL